eukprot:1023145_1
MHTQKYILFADTLKSRTPVLLHESLLGDLSMEVSLLLLLLIYMLSIVGCTDSHPLTSIISLFNTFVWLHVIRTRFVFPECRNIGSNASDGHALHCWIGGFIAQLEYDWMCDSEDW